jgi:toxin-antitoxin system PIN domain toxin
MDFLDVNVLVNAWRPDSARHEEFARYLQSLVNGLEAFAIPSLSFSGLMRIATHPRIFDPPDAINDVLKFVEQLRSLPHCIFAQPGDRHWSIFADLCRKRNARGNLVSDAYLAAMAIELGAELVTDDRGMARWPGLKWRRPMAN